MRKFKRFSIVSYGVALGLMCLIVRVGGEAEAKGKPEFIWKMQVAWAAGLGMNDIAKHHVKQIEKMSDGRIKIEYHYGGELVPELNVWDAVSKGVIDATHACTCYSAGRCFSSAYWCTYAGNCSPEEKHNWVVHGGGSNALEALLKPYYNNVKLVVSGMITETALYSNRPIDSLSDLQKMKIRSIGSRAETFKEMGCMGLVGLPASEIIPSLQKRVIDGAEFSSPWVDYRLGYADVCKYWYFSRLPSTGEHWLIINRKTWDTLPDDLKRIVEAAGVETNLWTIGQLNTQDMLVLAKVAEEKGVQVSLWPEEIDEAAQAAQKRIFERKKKDREFKVFHDSWIKFKDKYRKYNSIVDSCR